MNDPSSTWADGISSGLEIEANSRRNAPRFGMVMLTFVRFVVIGALVPPNLTFYAMSITVAENSHGPPLAGRLKCGFYSHTQKCRVRYAVRDDSDRRNWGLVIIVAR